MGHSGQYSRVISTLGHGITLQPEYYSDLAQRRIPQVDYMQLQTEQLLQLSGSAWLAAQAIRSQMPVALHGEGLGLGNTEGPSDNYLRELRALIERLEPALVSDHLCWTSYLGRHCHEALPLPRTASTLQRVVDNIRHTQDCLRRRIVIKNIASYVEFRDNELTEAEFICEISQQADCWILLDVGSVYINATNHGYDPTAFIQQLPAQRVQQVHLAAHTRDEHESTEPLLIDTRNGPVAEPVWALYRTAIEHCGDTPSVVDWSHDVPSLDRVLQESARARGISESLCAPELLQASA